MKKALLSVVALVLLMAPVVYADPVGDVAAECGKPAFSVGYYYDQQKLKIKDEDARTNFISNQVYVEGAFGVAEGWDAFVRFGGATGRTNVGDFRFQDDFAPYGSVGVRGYMPITKGFAFGPFAKFNYYGDWKDSVLGIDVKVKDNYDFMGGIAAKIELGKFSVYGGPFYYYARSKLKISLDDVSGSTKLENNRDFGGLLGVKVPIAKNLSVNAEGQYKSDKFSGGLFATYQF